MWTEEEDKLLLTSNLSNEEIAKKLKRTEDSVRSRRVRLRNILNKIQGSVESKETIKESTVDTNEIQEHLKMLSEVFKLSDSIEFKVGNYSVTIKKID